ncbi:ABC transporter permease subunit [Candidatus Latescibacterota bacterium]
MLLLTIRKEIVNNVLSFRFIVTYALQFCLVLLAVFLMANDFQAKMQEATTEETKIRQTIDEIDALDDPGKQFQDFQQLDLAGVRRPEPLSILARGLEGSLPTQVTTRRFWMQSSDDRLGRNMLFEVFQAPDYVYVINIVMSLLALLFVFDAVCGEKEQGTLKIMLANSLPRDTVLLAKWIGGYISVAAPFAVASLGGFAYVYISGAVEMDPQMMTRFGLIFAVSLLFISTFFTLGLMISVYTQRSATALLVSLLVWICWILVIPNVAPIVARLVAPVPSRQVIDAEKQAIDRESQLLLEGINKRKVYGDQEESEQIRQDADSRKGKLEEFYRDRMQRQVSLSQNLARVSPSASFLFAATRLAGTGPALFRSFHDALEHFQEAQDEYRMRTFRTVYSGRGPDGRPQISDADWFNPEDLPRFKMTGESTADGLNGALTDILLLAVYNVLFFMLAFMRFLRYDIT